MTFRLTAFPFEMLSERPSNEIQIPLLKQILEKALKEVNENQLKKMGDTAFIEVKQKISTFHQLCNRLDDLIIPISPDSMYLLLWNILNLIIIFFNFIEIPIVIFLGNVVYDSQFEDSVFVTIYYIMIVVLILDLLFVRGRIAIRKQEVLINSHYFTIKKYLKFQFFLDLISLIILIIYVAVIDNLIYLKIFFYLKCFTLFQINFEIENRLMLHVVLSALYKFLKMVFFIYFITNFVACIYFAIDYAYYMEKGFYFQNGYLWLTGSSTTGYMDIIESFSWQGWYIYALYWSVQTTSSTGYGDITPRNPVEVFFCNLVMLTTIVIFVIFANTVINIIDQIQSNFLKKQDKIQQLNNFIDSYDISSEVNDKIRQFIKKVIEINEDESERQIISLLSEDLQTSFKLTFKTQIFDNIEIFNHLIMENDRWNAFAKELVHLLHQNYYAAGSELCSIGEINNFKLMMVIRGQVSAKSYLNTFEKNIKEWQYFGQRQFFFNGKARFSYLCTFFSKIYSLERNQFLICIKKYQQTFQKYCQLLDGVFHNKRQTKMFQIQCQSCFQYHFLEHCEFNNAWRSRVAIVRRFLNDQNHQRTKYKRKKYFTIKKSNLKIATYRSIDKANNFKSYFPYRNIPCY